MANNTFPPKKKKPRARGQKYVGALKDKNPNNPLAIDHLKRCAYASKLHHLERLTWAECAARLWSKASSQPWPIDPSTGEPEQINALTGETLDQAVPLWGGKDPMMACAQSVRRFSQELRSNVKDEYIDAIVMNADMRQQAMAPGVYAGDPVSIAQHRAEDEWKIKVLAMMPAQKIAPTTPDGESQYDPASRALESIASKLASLASRREGEVSSEPDATGSAGA